MKGARLGFRAVLIAVLLAMQAMSPVFAYAKMARSGGLLQEICTPAGRKTVVIETDGAVREVAPESAAGEHCQLCSSGGVISVQSLILLHESVRHPGALRVGQTCYQAGEAVVIPPATGPPSSLL